MSGKYIAIIKTLRPVNLAIMVLTQYLAWYFLVLPVHHTLRIPPMLENWQFGLLVFITLITAAGGYLLNDYLDQEADEYNSPDRNQVGKLIPERSAYLASIILLGFAVALGFGLAISAGNFKLGLAFLVPVALLWAYNHFLKHYAVIGNVTVAFLTAFTIIIIGIFATPIFQQADAVTALATQYIWQGILGYAAFAFATNLIRELIKDIQDMRGDKYMGSRTLPVLLGERHTKFIAIVLLMLLIRMVLYPQQLYLADDVTRLPLALIPVQVLSLAGIVALWLANSPKGYGRASLILKLIMLAGVLTMPLYQILL